MSRHKRSKPGEGPYPYKERKLYYAVCKIHGSRYQSFYQRNIRTEACGLCRREQKKISPGQTKLFEAPGAPTGHIELPSEHIMPHQMEAQIQFNRNMHVNKILIKPRMMGQSALVGRATKVKFGKGKLMIKVKPTRYGKALIKKFKNTPRRRS